MNKLFNLTMGKKLGIGFGLMLAVTAALAVASLSAIVHLGSDFDAANEDVKKLEFASSLAIDGAQMLSCERAMLFRLQVNDTAGSEKFHNSFKEDNKLAISQIDVYRKMAKSDFAKQRLDALRVAITSWSPVHEEVWEASRKKNFKEALGILIQRSLPVAEKVDKITAELREHEAAVVDAAVDNGHSTIAGSRWVTIALIVLFAVSGLIVSMVVRRSTLELRHMASELKESADQIASAAGQVAASSQSLAQGASEQAASLEETSASTEELTSMVRKNAENSQSAAEVMTTVDHHVKDGNRTLEQMVVSMHEINASSDKISKIIKVIDEIAFQTNILALNAAVEAARAGEAGMGFAVVADEVRNLAQRSAQAAKDTASLIEESIAKSGQGSTKLQEVSDVIRAITESASKVKTLVDEVSLSSQEQARGIDQISKAVTQMDQTTQSTAASAEESASASEQLSAQAEAMKQVVHQLRAMVESRERDGESALPLAMLNTRAGSPARLRTSPVAQRKNGPNAFRSAGSRPEPRLRAASKAPLGVPAGKPDRDSFPLDDDFTEI